MPAPTTKYVILDARYVSKFLDAVIESGGQVLAINLPTTAVGQAPKIREIWYYGKVGPYDICREAGIPFRKEGAELEAVATIRRLSCREQS